MVTDKKYGVLKQFTSDEGYRQFVESDENLKQRFANWMYKKLGFKEE